MRDAIAITRRTGDDVEALLHDGHSLFHALTQLLEEQRGANKGEQDTLCASHMLASLGRDFMAEALRVIAADPSRRSAP